MQKRAFDHYPPSVDRNRDFTTTFAREIEGEGESRLLSQRLPSNADTFLSEARKHRIRQDDSARTHGLALRANNHGIANRSRRIHHAVVGQGQETRIAATAWDRGLTIVSSLDRCDMPVQPWYLQIFRSAQSWENLRTRYFPLADVSAYTNHDISATKTSQNKCNNPLRCLFFHRGAFFIYREENLGSLIYSFAYRHGLTRNCCDRTVARIERLESRC